MSNLKGKIAGKGSLKGSAKVILKGDDGFSPLVTIKETDTGYEIIVVDVKGVKTFTVNHGEKGDAGKGISGALLNNDYTLTLKFTDGTEYTTPSIRGEKGGKGDKGVGISQITSVTSEESGGTNAINIQLTEPDDTGKNNYEVKFKNGNDGKSAYKYARDGGYTGTEDEFAKKLAQENPTREEMAEEIADEANARIRAFSDVQQLINEKANMSDIERLNTLPYGGSKEWLETNGDETQLYQINGYTWGYTKSDGWTKSDTQFLVVTSESEMTNVGGTEYLLRNGSEGTVYEYTEASGDADIPVYDTLPDSSVSDGDIVAVGGKKYKATLTSKQVPNWTKNYADPSSSEWLHDTRCNSSGTTGFTGFTATNIIDVLNGGTVYVKGIDLETPIGTHYPIVQMHVKRGTVNNASKLASFSPYLGKTDDGIYMFSGDYKYYRFSGTVTDGDENVVITVGEEISYTTETTVSWTEIGDYSPPVETGWNATDETYFVIDSLSADATSGDSAVYSGDGYVYAYIGGSGWMQMSKYNAPTLFIDKELSSASTNLVQNKAIADAINNINTMIYHNEDNIVALNERVANIETDSDSVVIPSFWQDAVDECIAKIKALQVGRNCVTFPFFSDNHTRDGNPQYMGMMIAHIMKECGIPYCFCGGDAITSAVASTADTDAEFKAQAKAFFRDMSYIPDGRFCMALGNHEAVLKKNANIEGSTTVNYNRNQTYDIFIRETGTAQNKHFGGDGTYFYVEDIASKVRWIVLNTNGIGNSEIDATQLAWFENTALKFNEPGWGVVIISHIPITNHYEQSNITNNMAVISMIQKYRNSSDANKAVIIGWYSGHIHRDRIYTGVSVNDIDDSVGETLGFTQVTITSDHTTIAYPIGNSPTYHPVGNDDQSHAIDFVTINKDTQMVYLTRLGIGEDRSYSYAAAA